MTATIELAGIFEATISDAQVWRVRSFDPKVKESVEKLLNARFGITWEPSFGEYVPDVTALAAQEAAELYGAEVTNIGPPPETDQNAIQ